MKKKVLFIIWTFTAGGGSERILSNIVNSLDDSKYEISIKEYFNFGIKDEKINSNIKVLKPFIKYRENSKLIPSILLKLKVRLYDFLVYNCPIILRKASIKDRYDIEVSFNYMIPTFLTLKNKNTKNISWVHGSIEDLDYKGIKNIFKRLKVAKLNFLQKNSFKKFDNIVAISNSTYNSIKKIYPDTQNKLVKIYNGYDFRNIIKKSNENIEFKLQDNTPVILGVGRLDENKNFDLLIKSAKVLKQNNENFKVLILGDGPERGKLEKLISDLGLNDTVTLMGFMNNPYPYMKNAYMFCLTSIAEGFPTVIAETMSLGCPFISTNVAGIEELSDNGKCGIVVNRDEISMSRAIQQLLDDKELREKLSRACTEKVQEFSLERQITEIEKLFDN